MENDVIDNISIEEIEDEPIETTTVVNDELIHILAKSAVRRDAKHQRNKLFYIILAVSMYLLAAYFLYTYFITKTNTERGPAISLILIIMASFLLWYISQPLMQFMENRMKPFKGQCWNYSISDEGIGLVLNGQKGLFQWSEITGWWFEDGYYMMEVSGQNIAIQQADLDEYDEERLKSLMYIYLGNAMTFEDTTLNT